MKEKKKPEKIIQITYGIGGPYGLSNYGYMYEWQWKSKEWKLMSEGLKNKSKVGRRKPTKKT